MTFLSSALLLGRNQDVRLVTRRENHDIRLCRDLLVDRLGCIHCFLRRALEQRVTHRQQADDCRDDDVDILGQDGTLVAGQPATGGYISDNVALSVI